MTKWCAVDLETDGLDFTKNSILGAGFWLDGRGVYLTVPEEIRDYIKELTENGFKFSAHNQKFDWKFLRKANLIDDAFNFAFDPKIAIPLLINKPASNSLENAASFYSKTFPWKDEVAHKNLNNEDPKVVADYCLKDCEETYKLTLLLVKQLEDEGQYEFYFNSLLPLDHVLIRASYNGIMVDVQEIERQLKAYQGKAKAKRDEIRTTHADIVRPFEIVQLDQRAAKFKSDKGRQKALATPVEINLSSPKQLLTLLHTYAGINIRDTYGKPSTSDDALFLSSSYPIVRSIIEYRELEKPIQFFNQWMELKDNEDRIHTNFNVDIARTGRLSSSEPNIQQLPVRGDTSIRKCFRASSGKVFIDRDLSQIEPRFIAHYAQDEKLLQVYNEGLSLYGVVAKELGLWTGHANKLKSEDPNIYSATKTIVLAILYGMGSRKLSFDLWKDTGSDYSISQCRAFIQTFFDKFEGVARLREKAGKIAAQRGYLRNFFGRHVFVPKEKAERVAMNTLIQSSASDFMSLLQLYQAKTIKSLDARLLLLVHDSEIYEAPLKTAITVNKELEKQALEFGKSLGLRVPALTEGGIKQNLGPDILTDEDVLAMIRELETKWE